MHAFYECLNAEAAYQFAIRERSRLADTRCARKRFWQAYSRDMALYVMALQNIIGRREAEAIMAKERKSHGAVA